MIRRTGYLEWLKQWREKQIIKVITGVRRCGKSTLLLQYMDLLRTSGVSDEQIVAVNLDDIDFEHLLDYKILYKYIKSKLLIDKYTYIFIDEVQQCPNFEKAVDSLYIKENVDIYITGSNAYMLSGELATLLSGRYIEINMLPLSFAEYMEFAEQKQKRVLDIDVSTTSHKIVPTYNALVPRDEFSKYLHYGSFPYVSMLAEDDAVVKTYIDGIYNTIIVKDVINRESINDVAVLESVFKFLCSNIGCPVSIKKVSDTINSAGRSISVNTVERYVHALTDSFIFYKVDRYDIKGRQHLKTLSKYYLVDTGLRNMLLSGSSVDLGRQLENVVYLELLRRNNKVSIGKLGEREIDFIASNTDGVCYYQVAATVLNEDTLARELAPLDKTSDSHQKFLLTLDDILPNVNHNGIRQINILDWLLKNP